MLVVFLLIFVADIEQILSLKFRAPLTTGIKQKHPKNFNHSNLFRKPKSKTQLETDVSSNPNNLFSFVENYIRIDTYLINIANILATVSKGRSSGLYLEPASALSFF